MTIHDTAALRSAAARRLDRPGWFRLFGLSAAVSLGAGLIGSLLGLVLDAMIGDAGGLSGLETRSMLESIRSLLESGISMALPFWEIGLVFLSLQLARGEETETGSLLQGFRRFAPVLRLLLLKFLILMGATFALTYLFTAVAAYLPGTEEAATQLLPLLESGEAIDPEPVLAIMADTMLPAILLFVGAFLLVWVFISFRLRMAEYAIMSDDTHRAMAAIRGSWYLTKGNCSALLRLDLGFWWIYLIDGLVVGIFYLEWLLPAVGVPLPLDQTTLSWVAYGLYLVLRLVTYTFLHPRMQVTYALAYDALTHRTSEE